MWIFIKPSSGVIAGSFSRPRHRDEPRQIFSSLASAIASLFFLSISAHFYPPNSPRPLNSSAAMGSVVIPHLSSGWHVDQAILSEDERLVVIRFGRDWDPACMQQDEVLYKIAEKVKSFAVVYVCDIDQVPDFNQMYGTYRIINQGDSPASLVLGLTLLP